jgi:2-oxoglutarate ferredoxin oxidoreductase subunit beta
MAKKVFGRPKSLKENIFHYCPGCGHSIAHRLIAEVIDELGIRGITIGVPPAGCAVLAYNYFDFDMIEAPHGRGPAMATGIKRTLPDRVVFSYQGDGDLAAIGIAERKYLRHLYQQCCLWHDWRADGSDNDAGTKNNNHSCGAA